MESTYGKQFEKIIETAQRPSTKAKQVRESLTGQPPEEQLSRCREAFHSTIVPSLYDQGWEDDDVQGAVALFETTWTNLAQGQGVSQRGRSSSSSS